VMVLTKAETQGLLECELIKSMHTLRPLLPDPSSFVKHGWISDSYVVQGSILSKGSFSTVRLVTERRLNQARALKRIDLSKVSQKEVSNQIALWGHLGVGSPHIVRLYDVFRDDHYFYLVMDLCMGGRLFDHIFDAHVLTEQEAANIMNQTLKALWYMHSKGVCHRDLKPEHILVKSKESLSQCKVQVIDFSQACHFAPGEIMSTPAGTPYYSSPQLRRGCYTSACDAWSCGVVAYSMLRGFPKHAVNHVTRQELCQQVSCDEFELDSEDLGHVSPMARFHLLSLLACDEKDRCTAEQALTHEWIIRHAPSTSASPKHLQLADSAVRWTLPRIQTIESDRSGPDSSAVSCNSQSPK